MAAIIAGSISWAATGAGASAAARARADSAAWARFMRGSPPSPDRVRCAAAAPPSPRCPPRRGPSSAIVVAERVLPAEHAVEDPAPRVAARRGADHDVGLIGVGILDDLRLDHRREREVLERAVAGREERVRAADPGRAGEDGAGPDVARAVGRPQP